MPRVECGFADGRLGTGARRLTVFGPTIMVDIGFDENFDPASPQTPDMSSRQVPALVDTGASESCIDVGLAEELGLPVVDKRRIAGAGGAHQAPVYLGHIFFPQLQNAIYGRFAGVGLSDGGQLQKALIGRTFLANYMMIYDGPFGRVSLVR